MKYMLRSCTVKSLRGNNNFITHHSDMKTVPEMTKEIRLVGNCEKISASVERSAIKTEISDFGRALMNCCDSFWKCNAMPFKVSFVVSLGERATVRMEMTGR